MTRLMARLNDAHHAAICHIVGIVAVETDRRAFATGIHSDINHWLSLLQIQLMHRLQGKTAVSFLLHKPWATGVDPALGDAVGHGFGRFGRKGRIARHTATQVSGRYVNSATSSER